MPKSVQASEVGYYVFQVSDQSKYGKRRSAPETFGFLVRGRSAWGFGPHTPNRRSIKAGDKVVFYITGQDNQYFSGAAILKTGAYEDKSGDSKDWYLDPTTLRIDLKDVVIFSPPKSRHQIPNLEWRPLQGGSSRISERDYLAILGGSALDQHPPVTQEEMEFALERYLQEFIVANFEQIFGKRLKIYKDENGNEGSQYLTDIGYIDILARENSGDFIVMELKKGRSGDEVVGQTLRYMSWVRNHLARNGKVRGMIITQKSDAKLEYAVKEVADKIQLKNYQINFRLTDVALLQKEL